MPNHAPLKSIVHAQGAVFLYYCLSWWKRRALWGHAFSMWNRSTGCVDLLMHLGCLILCRSNMILLWYFWICVHPCEPCCRTASLILVSICLSCFLLERNPVVSHLTIRKTCPLFANSGRNSINNCYDICGARPRVIETNWFTQRTSNTNTQSKTKHCQGTGKMSGTTLLMSIRPNVIIT